MECLERKRDSRIRKKVGINMSKKVDPWGQTNIKNYTQLCAEFGIEEFPKVIRRLKNPPFWMRRGLIFGHKDFENIVKVINERKEFVMVTGLMPSGRFHLGHKIVADQMIFFQNLGAECFVVAADMESDWTRNIPLEQAKEIAIKEYLMNYIALGLKPKKTHFYFQTDGKKSYMNLSKFLAKKTTFNEVRAIYGEVSPAKLVSALTQVADILHPQLDEFGGPKPTIVPVGADQLPHINFTRDLAARTKSEFNFILPSAIFNILIPGLSGGKMSSSDPTSFIALTDSPRDIENKIKKYAFSGGRETIEAHRKHGGNPNVDISFQYLKYFFEPDDKKLKKIEEDYRSGRLLTSELKAITIEKINAFLKNHQQQREKAKDRINDFIYKG